MMVLIPGKIVTLRGALLAEREMIYQWLAHSDITSSMIGPPHFPEQPIPSYEEFAADFTDDFFSDTEDQTERSYLILTGNQPVGMVHYARFDDPDFMAELDIWLAGSEFCGRGYGSDALITLTDYLFQTRQIHTFVIRPSARNPRAIAAYQKAGFAIADPSFIVPLPGDYTDTVTLAKFYRKTGSKAPSF